VGGVLGSVTGEGGLLGGISGGGLLGGVSGEGGLLGSITGEGGLLGCVTGEGGLQGGLNGGAGLLGGLLGHSGGLLGGVLCGNAVTPTAAEAAVAELQPIASAISSQSSSAGDVAVNTLNLAQQLQHHQLI
ncbi:hypothetical protein, partial [Comamonas terrae]